MDVVGAVMAGGKSSRFGRDKALLELGGQSLLQRTVDVLRSVCIEVVIVGPRERSRQAVGAVVVPDEQPGIGPLGGISSALHARPGCAVVAVAVDMPFLSASLLRQLIELADAADVVLPVVGGRGQQLHAVYGPACLPAMDAQIRDGDYKVDRFFPLVKVVRVEEPELRRYDPGLRSFWNANTPETWNEILAEAGEGGRQ